LNGLIWKVIVVGTFAGVADTAFSTGSVISFCVCRK